jgi:hypothetical protein
MPYRCQCCRRAFFAVAEAVYNGCVFPVPFRTPDADFQSKSGRAAAGNLQRWLRISSSPKPILWADQGLRPLNEAEFLKCWFCARATSKAAIRQSLHSPVGKILSGKSLPRLTVFRFDL